MVIFISPFFRAIALDEGRMRRTARRRVIGFGHLFRKGGSRWGGMQTFRQMHRRVLVLRKCIIYGTQVFFQRGQLYHVITMLSRVSLPGRETRPALLLRPLPPLLLCCRRRGPLLPVRPRRSPALPLRRRRHSPRQPPPPLPPAWPPPPRGASRGASSPPPAIAAGGGRTRAVPPRERGGEALPDRRRRRRRRGCQRRLRQGDAHGRVQEEDIRGKVVLPPPRGARRRCAR